jgi:hypothetical protein
VHAIAAIARTTIEESRGFGRDTDTARRETGATARDATRRATWRRASRRPVPGPRHGWVRNVAVTVAPQFVDSSRPAADRIVS